MDQLKRFWDAFIEFLSTYDSYKVMEMAHNLKWEDVASNLYVWLIGMPTVGYMAYKRRFKTLIILSSLGAFLFLLKITLPTSGEEISFDKLMIFIGGCVVLVGLNLYLVFIRGS